MHQDKMVTCFLFAGTLTDSGCFSLVLQSNAQILEPFIWRSFEDTRNIQVNAKTIVILSALHAAVHLVEFPWLSERKVRAAMPFVLEDLLAQPPAYLHFAFKRDVPGFYQVVIIENKILREIIFNLESAGIMFDVITLDWCALKAGEACWTEAGTLVHDLTIKGFVDFEFARAHIASNIQKVPEDGLDPNVWIAQRLLERPLVQLCQGLFKSPARLHVDPQWLSLAQALCVILAASVFFGMLWKTYQVHHRLNSSHRELKSLYLKIFPHSTSKLPSNQQLRTLVAPDKAVNLRFWNLIHELSVVIGSGGGSIDKLSYESSGLTVSLQCSDFKELDKIQSRLIKSGVQVQQKNASTHGAKVYATLVLQ